MHRGADEHRVKKRSFAFALVYIKCFRTYSVYLSLRLPAQILYAGIHLCPLAVLRSCFGIRLALADGSGLPFSLYPPQAALESQTPQREARALPCRALKSTASERKIVTKETHQGCLSFLFKSPLPCKGEARALPCRRTDSTVPAEFANSHYRYKNVTARRSHLNISPKGRNISHARSAYFTEPKARFHTAAKLPYFTASQAVLATQKSGAHRSTAFLQN